MSKLSQRWEWYGKPLGEMSRDELIAALRHMGGLYSLLLDTIGAATRMTEYALVKCHYYEDESND